MRYRERRNTLASSMKTVTTLKTKEELIAHLEKTWNEKVLEVKFIPAMYDPRIQWDAHNVNVIFLRNGKPTKETFVGISDSQF